MQETSEISRIRYNEITEERLFEGKNEIFTRYKFDL
jgi:hypothetical protein